MKIYRVVVGHGTDFYGYNNGHEQARYFMDKKKAEAFYKTGEFTYKQTRITTTFKNGSISVATTGAAFFERRKADAKPYEKVELVEVIENHYWMEVIEVEE